MSDAQEQLSTLDQQIAALESQRAVVEQQLAEDPKRQTACDAVAAVVADNAALRGLLVIARADQAPQIHPDWVYVEFNAQAPAGQVQPLMEALLGVGGQLGVIDVEQEGGGFVVQRVTGRVYVHKDRAVEVLGDWGG